ncbi:MAG: secretion protein HlyD family protein, partial [Pseudomonas sp. 63_8]
MKSPQPGFNREAEMINFTSRQAVLLAAAVAVLAATAWWQLRPNGLGEGFASGNGRIEATEVDVATKLA